jgi:transcriptional regulator GlxA family with amidase domain
MKNGPRDLETTVRPSHARDATRRARECASAIERITAHIDAHFAQRVTLDDLARMAGWSRRRLTTLFLQHARQTIHDYLTEVRLRHAAVLIASGVKIEAVSLLVGYRSKKNLYRAFKARYGMHPTRYRASCGA